MIERESLQQDSLIPHKALISTAEKKVIAASKKGDFSTELGGLTRSQARAILLEFGEIITVDIHRSEKIGSEWIADISWHDY